MFYEEEVINGLLCWRDTPKGRWMALTTTAVNARMLEYRAQNASLFTALAQKEEELRRVSKEYIEVKNIAVGLCNAVTRFKDDSSDTYDRLSKALLPEQGGDGG